MTIVSQLIPKRKYSLVYHRSSDSRQLENKDAPSSNGQGQIHSSTDSDLCYLRETAEVSGQVSPAAPERQPKTRKSGELNKHFGHPSQAVFDDKADKTSELRDSDFSNEQFSKLPMFINSGLAMDGLFDDSEDESDKLNSPWDGTQSYSLFDVAFLFFFNSPCRDSVYPPKSLFSQDPKDASRSRSFFSTQVVFSITIFQVKIKVPRQ